MITTTNFDPEYWRTAIKSRRREIDEAHKDWAQDLGLRVSTRSACFCTLMRARRTAYIIEHVYPACGHVYADGLLDHAGIFMCAGKPAVLLSHVYVDQEDISARAQTVAGVLGLDLLVDAPRDRIYHDDTVSLRFSTQVFADALTLLGGI